MIYLLAAPCGIQERSSWDCTDMQTGGELQISSRFLQIGQVGARADQKPLPGRTLIFRFIISLLLGFEGG